MAADLALISQLLGAQLPRITAVLKRTPADAEASAQENTPAASAKIRADG